eukprot:198709_1
MSAVHFFQMLYTAITINILFVIVSIIILMRCIDNLICKRSVTVDDKKVIATNLDEQKKKRTVRIHKESLVISYEAFTRYTTIICLSLFIVVHIFTLITFLEYVAVGSTSLYNPFEITYTIAWLLSKSLMNCIFVSQLKYSFEGTPWMYSRCTFRLVYAFLLFIVALVLVLIGMLTYQAVMIWATGIFYLKWIPLATLGIVVLVVVIFYIVLTVLFYKKLFELMTSYFRCYSVYKYKEQTQKQEEQDELQTLKFSLNMENDSDDSQPTLTQSHIHNATERDATALSASTVQCLHHQLDRSDDFDATAQERIDIEPKKDRHTRNIKQYQKMFDFTKVQLITLSTQYTVLIVVSSLSFIAALFLFVVFSILVDIHDTEEIKTNVRLLRGFITMCDSFINCLCLYLHFSFSVKWYRFLCVRRFCLHSVCMSCIGNCAEKSMGADN